MKKTRWKSRPMTVWEMVGATIVAAVLLTVLYEVAHSFLASLHSHTH